MWRLLFIFLTVQWSSAVIYNLNDTEYDRMPPLFKLEKFHSCLRQPGDLYCQVEAELVSDEPSQLLDIIKEYSDSKMTHFNHSVLHWGVCVTKTCKEHLNRTTEVHRALEGCLNESLHRDYRLQARLHRDRVHCTGHDDPVILTPGHYVVAVFIVTILLLNLIASFCKYLLRNKKVNSDYMKLLLCFSMQSNWKKLVMPAGDGPEPRLKRLIGISGIKTLTTVGVIFAHSILPVALLANNSEFMEAMYDSYFYQISINGPLVVQSFFIVSGFLLAYSTLLEEEKKKLSPFYLPFGIVYRWLRLTPPYAVVLAFVATWWSITSRGPHWVDIVEIDANDCNAYWYQNLLYFENYVDYQQCMPHAWYLAADMQLTLLGLAIFSLTNPRARKIALGVTFVVGLLAAPLHTYFQNLYAVLVVSPEVSIKMFFGDPTFNNVYKRGHTNILNYTVGLYLAMLVYRMQKNNYDYTKLKKYNIIYYLSFPIMLLLCLSGMVFYSKSWEAPLIVKAIYSSGIKVAFGVLMSYIMIGLIFRTEAIYRTILEWQGWTVLGRMSYCAYLVHVVFIKSYVGTANVLIDASLARIFLLFFSIMVTSYITAIPLFILVESPFNQVAKWLIMPRKTNLRKEKSVSAVTQVVGVEKETVDEKL